MRMPDGSEVSNDHHAQPAPDLPRRRRHRPALVLQEARRLVLIAAAIDKYVYITVHQTFVAGLSSSIRSSSASSASRAAASDHPRGAEARSGSTATHLEMTSMADIPAGTGLGSSGSFTTALLKALHAIRSTSIHPQELAEQACDIEIDRLARAGRQAGPVHRRVRRAHLLRVPARRPRRGEAVQASTPKRSTTSRTTCSCSSPATRAAGKSILKEQDDRSREGDQEMTENLHFVKELGYAEPRGASRRATSQLRRAHERALGEEEALGRA